MRISDGSADLCSSELALATGQGDGETEGKQESAHGHPGEWTGTPRLASPSRAPKCRFRLKGFGPLPFKGRTGVGMGFGAGTRNFPGAEGIPIPTQPSPRSEEHTSELQSLMRISYAVFCLKKKKKKTIYILPTTINTN